MHCDYCNRRIHSEDDVNERILCYHCDASPRERKATDMHCFTCGSKLKWKKRFDTVKKKFGSFFASNRASILLLTAGALLAVLCGTMPHFAGIIVLGVLSIPLVVGTAIIVWKAIIMGVMRLTLIVAIHRLGKWLMRDTFIDTMRDEDMAEFLRWLFGALLLASPFILYGLGRLVYLLVTL